MKGFVYYGGLFVGIVLGSVAANVAISSITGNNNRNR